MKKDWRHRIDKETESHINELLLSSFPNEHNYKIAENPALAQIWIAIARLNERLKTVEDTIDFPKNRKKLIKDLEKY